MNKDNKDAFKIIVVILVALGLLIKIIMVLNDDYSFDFDDTFNKIIYGENYEEYQDFNDEYDFGGRDDGGYYFGPDGEFRGPGMDF